MWNEKRERNQLAVALYRELGNCRLVAERLGINHRTVNGILHRNGCPPDVKNRTYPESACAKHGEEMLQMCKDGASLSEIGRKFGTKGSIVRKFLRKNGVTKDFPTTKEGDQHYAWKGRLIDKDGYVLIHCKGHPNARKHSHYIFEHRLVMERLIGRILLPEEVVHHKDGNKQNNNPDNLQLFSENSAHLRHELTGRVPKWTPEGLANIRKALHQRKGKKLKRTPKA